MHLEVSANCQCPAKFPGKNLLLLCYSKNVSGVEFFALKLDFFFSIIDLKLLGETCIDNLRRIHNYIKSF